MKTHIVRLAFNVALVAGAAALVVMAGCSGPLTHAQCDTINGQARPVGCK